MAGATITAGTKIAGRAKAGPGKAENALMVELDAVAGGDDDREPGQHHERRCAADRQPIAEQDRDDRRQQSRQQAQRP